MPTVPGGDDIRDRLAHCTDPAAAAVVDLIVQDQGHRWLCGERVLVETYLAALPAPAGADVRMDLIYAEILLRESAGERPGPAEYSFRFPDLADRVRALFQLHESLCTEPAASPPPPRPSVDGEPATPAPYESAVELPGYDILEELSRGGMSVVYKARQVELGRTVAVKMLRPEGWAGELEDRLRREAEAIARVQHPNIVQIFEVGTHQGQPYLVLEYVSGGTLADRLRDGPLPPREAAAVTLTVAGAVHVAHGQGVIHRDLKPANVLLQRTEDSKAESVLSSVLCPL
jgi:serine/threonine protein kinase